MKWTKSIAFLVVLTQFSTSCEKDDGIIPQCVDCSLDSLKIDTTVAQVFILNEGNYGWNNGSISLYTPDDGVIQNNVFEKANGAVLGDVVQSMEIIGDKGYVVVNNSNKVVVVNIQTLEVEHTIENLNSPRFIKQVSANVAYITSLYGDAVYVLDLTTNSVNIEIAVSGWTEQLEVVGDYVYVVCPNDDKLLVIDAVQETIVKELPLGVWPNSIVKDRNNKIWVLNSGGYDEELARLVRIDSELKEIELTLQFEALASSPEDLSIDVYGERLFFNNHSIYTMTINEIVLPDVALISNNARNIYAFDVAPNTDLYLSDALDYTQEGYVYRYSTLGNLVDSFKVGVIPGNFCFN